MWAESLDQGLTATQRKQVLVSDLVMDGNRGQVRSTDRLVLETLVAADALEGFRRLHQGEQERFLAWVAKASDEVARQRRIANLVMGMRMVSLAR